MKGKSIICLTILLTLLLLGCLQLNENAQKAASEVELAEESFRNVKDFFEQKRYEEANQELDNSIQHINSAETFLNKAERDGINSQKINELKATLGILKNLESTFRELIYFTPRTADLESKFREAKTAWEQKETAEAIMYEISNFQKSLEKAVESMKEFESNYPDAASGMNIAISRNNFELINQNLELIKKSYEPFI